MAEVDSGFEQIFDRDPGQAPSPLTSLGRTAGGRDIPDYYRLLNWNRLRAPANPYFLRSLTRESDTSNPSFFS